MIGRNAQWDGTRWIRSAHPIAEATRYRTLSEFPKGARSVERNQLWLSSHDQESYPHEQYRNGKAKLGCIG